MAIRGEIFSSQVQTEKRTYFFNVKENRTGSHFLNLVESTILLIIINMNLFKKNNQKQMELHNSSTGETPVINDNVNHPSHYNQYPIEIIDMMVAVFGKEATFHFCLLNSF